MPKAPPSTYSVWGDIWSVKKAHANYSLTLFKRIRKKTYSYVKSMNFKSILNVKNAAQK